MKRMWTAFIVVLVGLAVCLPAGAADASMCPECLLSAVEMVKMVPSTTPTRDARRKGAGRKRKSKAS